MKVLSLTIISLFIYGMFFTLSVDAEKNKDLVNDSIAQSKAIEADFKKGKGTDDLKETNDSIDPPPAIL